MLAPLPAAFNRRCRDADLVRAEVPWHVEPVRGALALLLVVVSVAPAAAHMVVVPETSTAGSAERYTVIVPTEGDSATVRVELRLPMGVDVAAVESKPGWQASNQAFPIGAATVRWVGGKIPPGEMVSFDFLAVNPSAARVLTWNATQWYEDGSSDRWGDGAPEDHHASTTTLRAAEPGAASHEHGDHHVGAEPPKPGAGHDAPATAHDVPGHEHDDPAASARGSSLALWIAIASLALSAAALVVAMRRAP
jgi:uncharacterized protein YcnI